MKKMNRRLVACMIVGVIFVAPLSILAQANPIGTIDSGGVSVGLGPVGGSPVAADTLVERITALVNWFAWFIALVAVVMGLYAGFLFITARGEAAQLTTARATLVWAVIGIAVAVVSFSIILLTRSIFGV